MSVPSFSSFGKTSIFQLYDKDTLDHKVRFVQKSEGKEAVTLDTSIIYADRANQPRGELKATTTRTSGPLKGAVFEAVLQTDAKKASSLGVKAKNVFPVRLPGFNVALKETSSEKDFSTPAKYGLFGTAEADYTRPNFTATGAVTTDFDASHSVSASAAVGFEGFSLGGDAKFVKVGDKAFQPKSYNAGVSYRQNNWSLSAVTDAKFDKVKLNLLAKQPKGYTNWQEVGLQAKLDLPSSAERNPKELTFGLRYQAAPNTFYNGALVLNTGAGVFGVEHRLADPKLALTATAQFKRPSSAVAPFPVSRFGVGITFGEF